MKQEKENIKNANYYHKMLHNDTIVLLIISILFAMASIYFISKSNNEYLVPVFLKSILFIILDIIILTKKNKLTKSVGVLAIINGLLTVATSILDRSLFGIIYILLGIFYTIHAIIYLSKLKNVNHK